MKFTKFTIKNFKGIENLTLDFTKHPQGKIFPLVGLNESGKTTILEAIDLFQNEIENGREHEMIHKRKKGKFNGSIEIAATLQLEDQDKTFIRNFLRRKRLEMQDDIEEITITKIYFFLDSDYKEFLSEWHIPLMVKTSQRKDFINLHKGYKDHWSKLVKEMEDKYIPHILYFENFLFDFPEKIYLTTPDNAVTETDNQTQKEYREVLDDILSSVDPDYNFRKHILQRLESSSTSDREAVTQVLNEMSQKLNDVIVTPWKNILKDSAEITIEVKNSQDSNGHFLEFKIKQGAESFNIGERSLGFKWFFGFLLFTEFRTQRKVEKGEYIFLFDEPASNLHPAAQQALLNCFTNLAEKSKIIYSTHSHYLLIPKLLLTAFVVIDSGKKQNENGEMIWKDYSQNITAQPYRYFVSITSDSDDMHYQPLLDCLEYVENPFANNDNIVFLEGKYDYYMFQWIREKFFLGEDYNFNFRPGGGAGKFENIFCEYLATNKKFVAIFDADSAGKREKDRYLDSVSVELEKNIFTLEDVKSSFKGFQIEKLFFVSNKTDDRLIIQKKVFSNDKRYNKGRFNKAVQEIFINKAEIILTRTTQKNFKAVFDFIQQKFNDLS